ncbi:MAG: hypothetical protein AAFQ17_02525, partial [Pseudomonadota bacterium]
MRPLHAVRLFLIGGLLVTVGCDMTSIDPQTEALAPTSKLRHWDLLDRTDASGTSPVLRAFSSAEQDSVGVMVTFEDGTNVDQAEAELDQVFGTLAVRGRKYYRDGFEGAAIVVSADDVNALINVLQGTPYDKF